MADKSKIEWTDSTWNPVTGCTRVSEGCRNCYMARTVPRFGQDPWKVVLHPERLDQPLRWKKPRRIFVNSLSDLFHEDVPDEFISDVFAVMARCQRHSFQVITKRPQRMLAYMREFGHYEGKPLPNVWLGVSVENQETADERIPILLQTPAAVRFVSAEPLIGPVDIRRHLSDGRRTGISCTTSSGVVFGSSGRNDLEACRVQRRGNASAPFCRSETGGMQRVGDGRLPEDTISRPGREETGRGTSNCLDGNEQSGNSSCHGGQSRGRDQVSQSSSESDADDQAGKHTACLPSFGPKAEGTERNRQCLSQDERTAGDGNSHSMGRQGAVTESDSKTIRHNSERSFGHCDKEELGSYSLNWLIVGGESGPGARPMHPEWARSIRDQCQEAGVPFFFKQWGEWMPLSEMSEAENNALYISNRKAREHEDQDSIDESFGRRCKVESSVIRHDGKVFGITDQAAFELRDGRDSMTVFKVGKKAAGSMLDGRKWREFPQRGPHE